MVQLRCPLAFGLAALSMLAGCATRLSEAEPLKDVFCVQRAAVWLKDAVETAERQGGRAVDAHFRQDEELGCLTDRPSYYEVTLLSRGALKTVDVDAQSNQVQLRPRDESVWARLSRYLDSLAEPAPLNPGVAPPAKLSLPAAIDRAEEPNAKAVAAQLEEKDGRLKLAWVDAG